MVGRKGMIRQAVRSNLSRSRLDLKDYRKCKMLHLLLCGDVKDGERQQAGPVVHIVNTGLLLPHHAIASAASHLQVE